MSKQYILDKVEGLLGRIKFNHGEIENGEPVYYVMRVEFSGQGENGSAIKIASVGINIGKSRKTEFNPKEIYIALKNNTNENIANKLKALYLDLIGDDIGTNK